MIVNSALSPLEGVTLSECLVPVPIYGATAFKVLATTPPSST